MKYGFDKDYCINTFRTLLGTDSTTGQYQEIQDLVCGMLDEMGYEYSTLRKGGITADLGGEGHRRHAETHQHHPEADAPDRGDGRGY